MTKSKQRSTESSKPTTPAVVSLDAILKSVNTPSNIRNLISAFLVLFMLLTIPLLVLGTINQRDLKSLANTPTCTNLISTSDSIAPTVTIENPSEGDYVVGNSLLINIKASDNTCVKTVSLLIDGKLVKTFTSPPYVYSWDLRTVRAGTRAISVRTTDAAGNMSVSSTTVYRSAKSLINP